MDPNHRELLIELVSRSRVQRGVPSWQVTFAERRVQRAVMRHPQQSLLVDLPLRHLRAILEVGDGKVKRGLLQLVL